MCVYPIRKWDEFHVMWCKFAFAISNMWTACEVHTRTPIADDEKTAHLFCQLRFLFGIHVQWASMPNIFHRFFVVAVARTNRHRSDFRWSWLIFLLCFARSMWMRARARVCLQIGLLFNFHILCCCRTCSCPSMLALLTLLTTFVWVSESLVF